MQWDLALGGFLGSLLGGFLGILILGAGTVWYDHRKAQNNNLMDGKPFLEKQVQAYLVEHFSELFPGWKIYDNATEDELTDEDRRPIGIEYPVKKGRIDILCIDAKSNLVILELKRGRSTDRVVAQVERYITHVEQHIAKRGQMVEGIIIAGDFDSRIIDSIKRRKNISLWRFEWKLKLNKRPVLQVAQ